MTNAIVSNGWEFHLVGGSLFITSEADPEKQVQLNEGAVKDLLVYLSPHRVELVHQFKDGSQVFHLILNEHEQPIIVEIDVSNGKIDGFGAVESYEGYPDDL